ncbi:MAG: single-stranded DNA-binding protein [bacterium]|nr:single-stranded DNA-binding protein [bacterium]
MASRSLNLVQIIGNLTRDPELRYTPNGAAVCTFGVATNRSWTPTDGGETREEVEFHNIVSWGKLADLCNQLLRKGRKVYCSGRLQTRHWETPDGQRRDRTEIVLDQMILLDSRGLHPDAGVVRDDIVSSVRIEQPVAESAEEVKAEKKAESTERSRSEEVAPPPKAGKGKEEKPAVKADENVNVEDIPF